jgi:hypothetical protein
MLRPTILAIISLLTALVWSARASAQSLQSYQLEAWTLAGIRGHLNAFIQLDWSRSPEVTGRLCLPDGSERRLSGSNPKPGQLKLTFDGSIAITSDWRVSSIQLERQEQSYNGVAAIVWDAPYETLNRGNVNGRYFQFYRPRPNADWSRFGESSYGVNSVGVLGNDGKERSIPLNSFDRLDREGFLRFAVKNRLWVGDGGWDPGKLKIAFNPDRLSDVQKWLRAQPDRLAFETAIPPNTCGADIVFAALSVPPLLEFFYARRLQLSGLVLGAYPVVLGAGPDMLFISTKAAAITRVFFDQNSSLLERDQAVRRRILEIIDAFVVRRRPDFMQVGRVERLETGQPFAIRLRLVGPSLTSCDAARWERLLFQAMLVPGEANAVTMMIQIQEGFFAPGRQLPSDARFNENRIDDGPLQSLQSLMAGFFIDQGFSADDDSVKKASQFTCR